MGFFVNPISKPIFPKNLGWTPPPPPPWTVTFFNVVISYDVIESFVQAILKGKDIEELNKSLYTGALKTLLGVLQNISLEQGKSLSNNYKEIINILLRIVNKGRLNIKYRNVN